MTLAALIALFSRLRIWISIRIPGRLRFDVGIGGGEDPPGDEV